MCAWLELCGESELSGDQDGADDEDEDTDEDEDRREDVGESGSKDFQFSTVRDQGVLMLPLGFRAKRLEVLAIDGVVDSEGDDDVLGDVVPT